MTIDGILIVIAIFFLLVLALHLVPHVVLGLLWFNLGYFQIPLAKANPLLIVAFLCLPVTTFAGTLMHVFNGPDHWMMRVAIVCTTLAWDLHDNRKRFKTATASIKKTTKKSAKKIRQTA